jgi:hypothetical protein
MDEVMFQQQLSELLVEIQKYPQVGAQQVAEVREEIAGKQQKLRSSIANLQNSLDHLRLAIKYLAFDLEATKRENRVLRRLFEEGL